VVTNNDDGNRDAVEAVRRLLETRKRGDDGEALRTLECGGPGDEK